MRTARQPFPEKSRQWHVGDVCVTVYFSVLLLCCFLMREHVLRWELHVPLHFLMALVPFGSIVLCRCFPFSRWAFVARVFYVCPAFVYSYLALDSYQTMFVGGYVYTELFARWDIALVGVNPTAWAQGHYGSVWDEILSFFYLCYYLVPLVLTIRWLRKGLNEQALFGSAAIVTLYMVNYALFFILPAIGPRSMDGMESIYVSQIEGWLFGPLCLLTQGDAGAILGGVFPSGHASATFAWFLIAWPVDRKAAWVTLVFALGVAAATVYLGYHFFVDPLGGIILACVVVPLCRRLWINKGKQKEEP